MSELQEALLAIKEYGKALVKQGEVQLEMAKAIEQLQADMKEVLEITGISYERWRKIKGEEATKFIQERREHWRKEGFGYHESGRMAIDDLKEKRRLENDTYQTPA